MLAVLSCVAQHRVLFSDTVYRCAVGAGGIVETGYVRTGVKLEKKENVGEGRVEGQKGSETMGGRTSKMRKSVRGGPEASARKGSRNQPGGYREKQKKKICNLVGWVLSLSPFHLQLSAPIAPRPGALVRLPAFSVISVK